MGVGFALQTEPPSVLAQGGSSQWQARTCGSESESGQSQARKSPVGRQQSCPTWQVNVWSFCPKRESRTNSCWFPGWKLYLGLCQECSKLDHSGANLLLYNKRFECEQGNMTHRREEVAQRACLCLRMCSCAFLCVCVFVCVRAPVCPGV